ncbi:MAG: hypothetical protein WCE54_20365 [Ignavibacteriaceae bacterium]
MATRRTNIFGKLSGRLGNTTARIRYGKEVVYSLPDKVKVSSSMAAVAARKKFALTVNFSKFVNSVPALSAVWKAAKVPGVNSYQRLIKHNPVSKDEINLTIKNIITPPGNLPGPLNCLYKDTAITLEIDSQLKSSLPFFVHMVLYFYEPVEINSNNLSFEYMQKEIASLEAGDSIRVSLGLNEAQKLLFEKYNRCILYTALTSSKEKVEWSPTFSLNLK